MIYGVGTSFFGKQTETDLRVLAWKAILEALADAGLDSVDAAYVGTAYSELGTAQQILSALGITEVPILTLENASASGTTAFHEARWAIESGRYERVLVVGVEHMTSKFAEAVRPAASDPEGRSGMAMPALYAMAAQRYIATSLATPKQLAMVAVKNLGNALWNPRTERKGSYSIEEILTSRMIADPLTRLQCCSITDGAGAVVLGPPRANRRDIVIRGSALRSGKLWDYRSEHVWGFEIVRDTARDAFEEAGIEATDSDVFEVHDAFTIGEIVATEALGLAELGAGGRLVEAGQTAISGAYPVNPSGGLLARGHPIGATGVAQVYEIVTQLRGEAGDRQVRDCRIGVVETMGGGVSGVDGNGCVITVLEKA